MAKQTDEKPLPLTVEEWVKDPRGPIPPGRGAHVDRGLPTPWEVIADVWREWRATRTSSRPR